MSDFELKINSRESLESIVAKTIAKEWRHIAYDTPTGRFVFFDRVTNVWTYVDEDEIQRQVMLFVEERPEFIQEKTTQHKFWKAVTVNLRFRLATVMTPTSGVMTRDCFFNFETMKEEIPSPNHHCFNFIDESFDRSRSMNPKIVQFIGSVSNYKQSQVNILRYFAKCLLLNQNFPHMVLFLIGPGPSA